VLHSFEEAAGLIVILNLSEISCVASDVWWQICIVNTRGFTWIVFFTLYIGYLNFIPGLIVGPQLTFRIYMGYLLTRSSFNE
jgi:hypothetical protein